MLKLIICLFYSWNVFAYEIQEEEISFSYGPVDEVSTPCRHTMVNEMAKTWEVRCQFYQQTKQFTVHLRANKYHTPHIRADQLELLYWVTQRYLNTQKLNFTGTTAWIKFGKQTPVKSVELSQEVENGFAYLSLNFTPYSSF